MLAAASLVTDTVAAQIDQGTTLVGGMISSSPSTVSTSSGLDLSVVAGGTIAGLSGITTLGGVSALISHVTNAGTITGTNAAISP